MKHHLYLRDEKLEVEIDVEYNGVFQPAFTSGHPEECYPTYGEMKLKGYSVVSVRDMTDEQDQPAPTQEELDVAYAADKESIVRACWGHFHDNR